MTSESEKKLDKKIDRLLDLAEDKIQQQSGHYSNFLKEVNELKGKLMNLENNFNTFRGEAQPMIDVFKDNQIEKVIVKRWSILIYRKALWIGAVAMALGAIWAGIKFGGEILLGIIKNK